MASRPTGGGEHRLISDINVTPLVDIVLVLLIILMVTATAIAAEAIRVDLPRASSGEQQQNASDLSISVDADGRFYLADERVEPRELRARIRAAHDERPGVRAVIAADGRTAHARVIEVIDIIKSEGIAQFAINVTRDTGE